MITLVLAAAVASQVYADDFYFEMAQENFVIDNLPKPLGYTQYIPAELAEQVDLWSTDCWRCRKHANQVVVAMGPGVIRYLFWPLRAKDLRTSMHAEAVIDALIRCRKCRGEGKCPGFRAGDQTKLFCENCGFRDYAHWFQAPSCPTCGGRGIFEYPE